MNLYVHTRHLFWIHKCIHLTRAHIHVYLYKLCSPTLVLTFGLTVHQPRGIAERLIESLKWNHVYCRDWMKYRILGGFVNRISRGGRKKVFGEDLLGIHRIRYVHRDLSVVRFSSIIFPYFILFLLPFRNFRIWMVKKKKKKTVYIRENDSCYTNVRSNCVQITIYVYENARARALVFVCVCVSFIIHTHTQSIKNIIIILMV